MYYVYRTYQYTSHCAQKKLKKKTVIKRIKICLLINNNNLHPLLLLNIKFSTKCEYNSMKFLDELMKMKYLLTERQGLKCKCLLPDITYMHIEA